MKNISVTKFLSSLAIVASVSMLSAQKTGFSDRKWYLDGTKSGRDYITLHSDGKYQLELKNKTENGYWKYDDTAKLLELRGKDNVSRKYQIEKLNFGELILISPEQEKMRFIIRTEM